MIGDDDGIRTMMVVPSPAADSICTRCADQGRPLLHSEQPEPLMRRSAVPLLEAHTVVFDDERHVIGAPLEDHVDVLGTSMLGDVVQRFLGDAVERRFDL